MNTATPTNRAPPPTQPHYQYDTKEQDSFSSHAISSRSRPSSPTAQDPPAPLHNGFVHRVKTFFSHSDDHSSTSSAPSSRALSDTDRRLRSATHDLAALRRSLTHYERVRNQADSALFGVLSAFERADSHENSVLALNAFKQQRDINAQYTHMSTGLVQQISSLSSQFQSQYAQFRGDLRKRAIALKNFYYYRSKVQNLLIKQNQHDESHSAKLSRNMAKFHDSRRNFVFFSERAETGANSLWRLHHEGVREKLSQFLMQLAGWEQQNNVFSQLVAHGICERMERVRGQDFHALPADFRRMEDELLEDEGVRHDDPHALTHHNQQQLYAQPGAGAERESMGIGAENRVGIENARDVQVLAESEMIRSEERLRVRHLRYPVATMRVRKVLKSELVTMQVEVRKEDLEIEQIPVPSRVTERDMIVDAAGITIAPGATGGAGVGENYNNMAERGEEEVEQIFILREERPRVLMEWYPIEKVRVQKLITTANQVVEADLKKEKIEFQQTNTSDYYEKGMNRDLTGLGLQKTGGLIEDKQMNTGNVGKERFATDGYSGEPGAVKDEHFYAPIVH